MRTAQTATTSTTATSTSTAPRWEEQRMPVRAKLAAGWTSFMFLYAYVDILNFYKPGVVDDIRGGTVWELDISQTWACAALTLVAIPILLVVLSMTLPARTARVTNLVVACVYVPVSVFNVVDDSWRSFYSLGVGLEAMVLALILRSAWTWPRTALPATEATSGERDALRAPRAS